MNALARAGRVPASVPAKAMAVAALVTGLRRGMAAAGTPAAPGATDAKKSGASGPTVKGVAYLKDAPEPPQLPADQYPAWLGPLADKPKASGDKLSPADGKVFFKKANLVQIKKDNFLKDKKR